MTKPLKFHQTLNLPPRSQARGKHRRAGAPAHGSPIIRADYSPGGAYAGSYTVWTTANSGAPTFSWSAIDAILAATKPPAVPYAGIRTGEIIGHRAWWVMDGALSSLAHRRIWQVDETVCGNLEEPVGGMFDRIWGGVYAFFTQEQIHEEMSENKHAENFPWVGGLRFEPVIIQGLAIGTVKMWGEVIEHETGWRSQFAKLHSIDEVHGSVDIDALRAHYFQS
jgi:hypothetical protein